MFYAIYYPHYSDLIRKVIVDATVNLIDKYNDGTASSEEVEKIRDLLAKNENYTSTKWIPEDDIET
jgi:hypothetical protein